MPLDTKSLGTTTDEEKADVGVDSSVLTDVKVQGISSFTEGDMLRLEIEGSPEPVILEPKAEAIFGRRDPATGALPDIDLTPYAGYRMGVSRRHAAIRQNNEQSLDLWDLGSSNGTYLNGQRLNAHRPYRLHNGDEIRLGQMLIRVSFESGGEKKPAEEQEKDKDTAPLSETPEAEAKAAAPATESAPRPAAPAEEKAEIAEASKPTTESISPESVAKALGPTSETAIAPEPAKPPEEKPSAPEEKVTAAPEKDAQAGEAAKDAQETAVETETPEKPAADAKLDDKKPTTEVSAKQPAAPEKPDTAEKDTTGKDIADKDIGKEADNSAEKKEDKPD